MTGPPGENCTKSLKKVFPRLRELTPTPRGGITQPRKSFAEVLCIVFG